jgi:hypothetical protein
VLPSYPTMLPLEVAFIFFEVVLNALSGNASVTKFLTLYPFKAASIM